MGSAIVRNLEQRGITELITRTHKELDLTSQQEIKAFFEEEKPDFVILAAAKVGGINAKERGFNNIYPANFIYENLMVESNVIHASFLNNVKRLLFLGSSCIYQKVVAQPMLENALLTDTLESANKPYAIAKIAGIKHCESYNRQQGKDYHSVMPTNLYDVGDISMQKIHTL